ncbi:MAG: hypothetical protein RI947_155 [Candidatus Parcubacteria bacterium]|jgi:GT2 family glycosyltransferase
MKKRIYAIIILGYNSKPFLKECIESARSQTTPADIFFIDNASHDHSAEYVRKNFPYVTVTVHGSNLGYATAYNTAIEECFSRGYEGCFLINPDVVIQPDCLYHITQTYNAHTKCGLIQPSILLKNTEKINTIGNSIQFLGFGYCRDIDKTFKPASVDEAIISASGAALFVPRSFFQDVGGFQELFFMYGEDQDLSWRGLMKGYVHYLSAQALAYHDYEFSRNTQKWYHSEKNRLMMVLQNYSLKTIILIAPLFLVHELLMLFFHIYNHTFVQKMRAYLFVIMNLRRVMKIRSKVQNERSIQDADIVPQFDGALDSPLFRMAILKYLINPVYKLWHALLCKVL